MGSNLTIIIINSDISIRDFCTAHSNFNVKLINILWGVITTASTAAVELIFRRFIIFN